MTFSDLKKIKCPYCDHKLEISSIFQKNKTITYASAFCECEEYPIVEGIIILNKKCAKKIVYLLQSNQLDKALIEALDLGNKKRFFVQLSCRLFQIVSRLLSSKDQSYRKTIQFLFKSFPNIFLEKYMMDRKKEVDFYFFLLPFLSIKKRAKLDWVNIGSGATTFYSLLRSLSSTDFKFISLDQSFLFLVYSKLQDSQQDDLFICTDLNNGTPLAVSSEIVTVLDSLPFYNQQKEFIEDIFSPHFTQKTDLIFISEIPEHFYFDSLNVEVYPLSKKTFKTFAPQEVRKNLVFLDDKVLVDGLKRNQINIRDAKITMDSRHPKMRYSVIWKKDNVPDIIDIRETDILRIPDYYWFEKKYTWRNKVY